MKRDTFIKIKDLTYQYPKRENETENTFALKNISMDIRRGEFVGIIGHNGSGKSTIAKLLNGIIIPEDGDVIIDGMNTKDEKNLWDIRQKAGMVFQNPDNQLVSTIVEEDVAFGPENLGVETSEIRHRVDEALANVTMGAYQHHKVNELSGGQKQRIAIAGILAMEPECIIFDEPTAMLDPKGRQEVMDTILRLNREKGMTVILITHHMVELTQADRIFVIDEGKIVMEGRPEVIFNEVEKLRSIKLDVPQMAILSKLLCDAGMDLPTGILTVEKMAEVLTC